MDDTNNNSDLLAELKAVETQGYYPDRLITTAHGLVYRQSTPEAERASLQRLLAHTREAEQVS